MTSSTHDIAARMMSMSDRDLMQITVDNDTVITVALGAMEVVGVRLHDDYLSIALEHTEEDSLCEI